MKKNKIDPRIIENTITPGADDEQLRSHFDYLGALERSIRSPFPDTLSPGLPLLKQAYELSESGDDESAGAILKQAEDIDPDATSIYRARYALIKDNRRKQQNIKQGKSEKRLNPADPMRDAQKGELRKSVISEEIEYKAKLEKRTDKMDLKDVTIYTDGACSGNPGPGGYGVVLFYGDFKKEKCGGFRKTTNNRMEIMAAIVGLESLKEKCHVTVHSDSEYLVKTMSEGWAKRWKDNNWKRNNKDKATNIDLWDKLLKLCELHEVEFKWVKGHDSHTENNRCDQIAVKAMNMPDLQVDTGYEGLS
jgi:ribonuclease HI